MVLRVRTADGVSGDEGLADAVRKSSTTRLYNDEIAKGWTETHDGMLHHFIGVECANDAEFQTVIRSLSARKATQVGELVAELNFASAVHVSLATTAGIRGKLTAVSHSELMGIAVIIDELSDERDRSSKAWYDVRAHSLPTSAVRDSYNRASEAIDVERILTVGGWEKVETNGRLTRFTASDGRVGDLIHETRAFVELDEAGMVAQVFRAFDLTALYENRASVDPAGEGKPDPERTANWLLEEGHVTLEVEVLEARSGKREIEENQPTVEIVKELIAAIRSARTVSDAAMPLAFVHEVAGVPVGVISLGPHGGVLTWDERNASVLFMAVANLVNRRSDEAVTYRHAYPSAVVQSTLKSLLAPGALPRVEIIAYEPVLTKSGRIASVSGYDKEARAIVAIPFRDRAKWRQMYSVPDEPTLEQAQAAYETLDAELLADFCFTSGTDRARAMAYLLTGVARPNLNGSIGFLTSAADAGSGKSALMLLGRNLSTGRPDAQRFRAQQAADAEVEKDLGTLQLSVAAAPKWFHCDEVPRGSNLSGETVTMAITATDGELRVRKLGVSEAIQISGQIISACGNNVEASADLARRFLRIELSYSTGTSVLARAGFRHKDLQGYVRENRPALFAMAHTILLYAMQHAPTWDVPTMGFSHNWAPSILGAMSHLRTTDGTTDVAELAYRGWLDEVDTGNGTSEDWAEAAHCLWERLGGESAPVTDIRMHITRPTMPKGPVPALPEKLRDMQYQSDKDADKNLGVALRSIKGTAIRHENGVIYRIDAVPQPSSSKRSRRWFVIAIDKAGDIIEPNTPVTIPDEPPVDFS
jgi:hypothetical protein